MQTIGIDIGATTVSFILLGNKRILNKKKIQIPKNKDKFLEALKENIQEIINNSSQKVTGLGLGVPGPLDVQGGLILNTPNLRYLRNYPLAKIIEDHFKIKTKMENDGNCFALGEAIMGAGKKAKVLYGVTLGSGIGNGIVIDGKIYRGVFGSAGEAGHMTIKFDGLKCTCGSFGCWEEYASRKFIQREAKMEPKELFELAKKGDKKAQKIFKQFGINLGIGLANIINILDPEIIVIGGGIAQAGELIFRPARLEIKKRVISPLSKKYVKIKGSELGDLAGAIGAALL